MQWTLPRTGGAVRHSDATRRRVPARAHWTALLAACLVVLAVAPAAGAQRDKPPASEPGRDERLHQAMLQLRTLERQGNNAEAIRFGEALLAEFPNERRVEDALLDLYRAERRDAELIGLLTKRLERDPDDLGAARELGAHLLARQRHDEALAILRKVIAANPKDEARYRTAAVLFRSHRLNDIAIDLYRDGRRAIGQESLFAAELAQLEEARGDYGAAVGEYLVLVMDPDRRTRAREKVVQLLERAENPDAILSSVRELMKKHPKSAPVQDVAATVYLQSARYDDAFTAIRNADRYAEDQGELLLEFGRLALKSHDGEPVAVERARLGVRALKRVTEVHPGTPLGPEASLLIGEGLVSVARTQEDSAARASLLQEAVASLGTSIQEAPSEAQQRDALALMGMIQFEDLRQNEAALNTFQELIRRQKEDGQAHHVAQVQAGSVLAAMGRTDEARRVLREIADTTPPPGLQLEEPRRQARPREASPEAVGRARARFQLAELDAIEGNYEAAIDGFAAVAEEAPDDRMANDCLDLALTLNEASFYDPPEALKRYSAYRRALVQRDPQRTRAALQDILDHHQGSMLYGLALFELGRWFSRERKYEVALQYYASVVDSLPQHRLAPRSLEAMAEVQVHHLGQPEKAVANYERILLEYPDDLFLDDVRRDLLKARHAVEAAKGNDANP
jgi:tetratricopeptide (TPR) repeat protein